MSVNTDALPGKQHIMSDKKQQFLSDKMTGFKNGHFLVVVLTASIKRLGFERTFRKKRYRYML